MLDRLLRASQQLFRTSRDSRSLSKKYQKIFRIFTDFVQLLQLYKNYLGPPETPGVFQKVVENIQKLDRLCKASTTLQKIFRTSRATRSLSKKSQKIFRSLTDFVDFLQLHNSYFGPPGTPQESFKKYQKIFRSFTDFLELLQRHKNYLGLPGTPGVLQKILENIQKLHRLSRASTTIQKIPRTQKSFIKSCKIFTCLTDF